MKNSLLTVSAIVAISATAIAQVKLDPASRARLHAQQATTQFVKVGNDKVRVKMPTRTDSDPMINAFITLVPGATSSALDSIGVSTRTTRTGVVLASFPLSLLDAIEKLDCVEAIQTEQPVNLKLDKVRELTGVDKIHAGTDLPLPYTGKGVLCGIVDGGFDPNHVNFLNQDGTSRIKQFTYFRGMQNSDQLLEQRISDDEIYEIDSENFDSFHATHTTGIMAGGYRGKVSVCNGDYNHFERTEIDNPYYGIAPEADIATASAYRNQLSDIYIAYGVESILDWAYEHNQPATINLSLGSNVGPHDGTSPICRYLDAIIDDPQVNAHVCISAGNEGYMPIALSHTCKAEGEEFGTLLYPMYADDLPGYKNPRAGLIYIYSDTDQPFEIQGQVVSKSRGSAAARFTIDSNPQGDSKYYITDSGYAQGDYDVVHVGFGRYFNGYFGINVGVEQASGRYYAVIDYMTTDNVAGNSDGNYLLGFMITGHEGQRINVYGDGDYCSFSSYGLSAKNYLDGQFDGTISDIACGHNAIVVGSYNSRENWMNLDGGIYAYEDDPIVSGKMTNFTSYGSLNDGRTLPDICAPGATVISSTNEYYLQAQNIDNDENVQARVNNGKRNYSWHQCMGTSMSAPVVAGTLALWLEAYPELKCADAKRILKETAVVDDDVLTSGNPVQWGAGKLDAYAGLKKVLELKYADVDRINADDDNRLLFKALGNNSFEIFLAGSDRIHTRIYSVSGACVLDDVQKGHQAVVECSSLIPGLYIVNVNNKYSQKIMIN